MTIIENKQTYCIDCNKPTIPGKGSARCPECWEDRCNIILKENDEQKY